MDIWSLPACTSGFTWGELRDAFLASRTDNTRLAYRAAIKGFYDFTGTQPHEITVIQVQAWREQLKSWKATTLRARLAALSSWYNWLTRPTSAQGGSIVPANPVKGIPREKLQEYSNPRKINQPTFLRIYQACDRPLDQALLLAYVLTGRRRSELGRLRWQHIEHAGDVWHYTYRIKGGRVKRRQLPPMVVEALKQCLAGAEVPSTGRIWLTGDKGFAERLKDYSSKAGLDPTAIHIHGLRHLAAQMQLEDANGDIRKVSEFLDHSSIAITVRYLEALRDDVDEASNRIGRRLLG